MERGPLRVNFQGWALEINIDPARKVWKRYAQPPNAEPLLKPDPAERDPLEDESPPPSDIGKSDTGNHDNQATRASAIPSLSTGNIKPNEEGTIATGVSAPPGTVWTGLKAPPGTTLYSVDDITSRYDDNEIKAESIFRDKPAIVWGTVSDISTGIISGATVSLSSGWGSPGFDCVVQKEQMAAFEAIHKGSLVLLMGQGGQKIMGTVFFHDCALMLIVPQEQDWAVALRYLSRKSQLQNKPNNPQQ
jgi:hypothetical protein